MTSELTIAWLLVFVWAVAEAWDRRSVVVEPVRSRIGGTEPDPVEQLQNDWVEGRISREEFEKRLTFALDTDQEVVVGELTPVDHVGEQRAREIAREFRTVEAVRRADRDDLEAVDGVGPATAEAIEEHFQEPSDSFSNIPENYPQPMTESF